MKLMRKITVLLLALSLILVPFALLSRATADTSEFASGESEAAMVTERPSDDQPAAAVTEMPVGSLLTEAVPEGSEEDLSVEIVAENPARDLSAGSIASVAESLDSDQPAASVTESPADDPSFAKSTASSEETPSGENVSLPTVPVPGEGFSGSRNTDTSSAESAISETGTPLSDGFVIRLAGEDLQVVAVCVYGESEDDAFLHGAKNDYRSWQNLMQQKDGVYEITYKGCEGGKNAKFKFALNGSQDIVFGSQPGKVELVPGVEVPAAFNGGNFSLPAFEGKADITLRLDLTGYNSETTQGATFLLSIIIENAEPAGDPTPVPTGEPTVNPALTPTIAPTSNPALTPTIAPTSNPTLTPTIAPTATPAPEVKSVKLNKITLRRTKGRSYRLTATVSPANADSRKITWRTSNAKVATVSQNGFVIGRTVGTAMITATAPNGVHATCKVTVVSRQVRQFTKNGVYRFSTSTVTQKKLLNKKYVQSNAFRVCGFSHTPVYWITTPGTGHHRLSADPYVVMAARARGDKVGRAFFANDAVTSKPVFELMQMTKVRNYRYTTDAKMKNYLVSIGWVNNGIIFYAEEN